jgi:tetratricopeptide (TPR) repeat protein
MSVDQARAAIRQMCGRWRLRIWVALAVVLGVGLGWVPLFGVLGFELATAVALFAAVMGLDVGSALARELQRMPAVGVERAPYAGPAMVRGVLAASGLAVAVTVIPAVIAAVRGLWTPTCDWWFGIATYLAMPIITASLAGAVGHALGVVCGPRRFVGAAVAQLPVLFVVLAALWRFYSEPPVLSYNAILGYFPGNLYDENIRPGLPLVWSRLEDAAWVAALVALVAFRLDVPRHRVGWRLVRPAGRRIAVLAVAAGCLAGAIGLHLHAGALGYAVDAEDIEAVLDGRIETAHFIIHYAHTKDIDADIDVIARDHEFRYAEVVAQLGVAPEGKLRSFYFADREQKARWFGARDVEMAKPWRREIYLEHRAFPHGSLRHEIAHAVASAFGDPLFGVAIQHGVFANPGLIEGLAVAIDWPGGYDRPTPHEAVRAMQGMGVEPSIGQLLSLQFFAVSSARGYTTAGSFLRFLLDRYGAEKLRALYRTGGDFAAAYGAPLAALEAEWRTMIGQIELPPGSIEAQRERFRGVSVFARPCPHAIAAWRERAFRALIAGDRPAAVALLRRVCSHAPEEPRHRMELADMLVAGDPAEHAEAAALWTALAHDTEHVTSTLRVEVLERLAREAAARGDRAAVKARIQEASALPIDANERRQLDAEVFALAHRGAAAMPLYAYFFVPGPIDTAMLAQWAVLVEPDLGFAHYLLGLQRALQGQWAEATDELDRALTLGLPNPLFVRNAARRLAIAGYRSYDSVRLQQAIATLSGPDMTTSDHLLAKDWQDRIAFDAAVAH